MKTNRWLNRHPIMSNHQQEGDPFLNPAPTHCRSQVILNLFSPNKPTLIQEGMWHICVYALTALYIGIILALDCKLKTTQWIGMWLQFLSLFIHIGHNEIF
jgi:hypothetical protein